MWYDTQKVTAIKSEIATRLDIADILKPPCVGVASNPVTPACRYWAPVVLTDLDNANNAVVRTVKCCHNPAGQKQDFSCHTI